MKLVKIVSLDGTVECVTGLAIKNGANDLSIGGADSEVVKNPLTNEPYLPGSSLKGKMRSQLERKYGAKRKDGKITDQVPCGCGQKDCLTCVVFGAHFNQDATSAPTRIIVRDCNFTKDFRKKIKELPFERGNYLEEKWENIIDRKQGTAKYPRSMERVPAGATFELHIKLQIFEGDDEQKLLEYVKEGLRLVESSYLGGSGSRGYGQVKFDYTVTEDVL